MKNFQKKKSINIYFFPFLFFFSFQLKKSFFGFTQEKSRPDISSFHWLLPVLFGDILLKYILSGLTNGCYMVVRNR